MEKKKKTLTITWTSSCAKSFVRLNLHPYFYFKCGCKTTGFFGQEKVRSMARGGVISKSINYGRSGRNDLLLINVNGSAPFC